jgi:hypothetical protein
VLEETRALADDAVKEAVDAGDKAAQTEAKALRKQVRARAAELRSAG